MENMETIVVMGATGYVGNVLVRELIARGQVIYALVIPGDDCRFIAGLNPEVIYGDITD